MKPIQEDVYNAVKAVAEEKRVSGHIRPRIIAEHSFCLPKNRCQQRSALKIGLFKINSVTLQLKTAINPLKS